MAALLGRRRWWRRRRGIQSESIDRLLLLLLLLIVVLLRMRMGDVMLMIAVMSGGHLQGMMGVLMVVLVGVIWRVVIDVAERGGRGGALVDGVRLIRRVAAHRIRADVGYGQSGVVRRRRPDMTLRDADILVKGPVRVSRIVRRSPGALAAVVDFTSSSSASSSSASTSCTQRPVGRDVEIVFEPHRTRMMMIHRHITNVMKGVGVIEDRRCGAVEDRRCGVGCLAVTGSDQMVALASRRRRRVVFADRHGNIVSQISQAVFLVCFSFFLLRCLFR